MARSAGVVVGMGWASEGCAGLAKQWFVARTQPGLGHLAERELARPYGDRDAFRCLRPLLNGSSLFGPYILIEFDLEHDYWEPINGVRGISRLLPMSLPRPSPLPLGFVSDLLEGLGRGDFDLYRAEELVYAYSVGERVRVVSGAWEGHEGKFIRKNKGYINLSLVLFQRAVEIPIPSHQVRPASRQAA